MTRDEVAERVRAMVAKNFGVDAESLTDETTADDVDGWDSLAHATLVMRLEKIFDLDIDVQQANASPNLGALTDLIFSLQT